jgi:putative transposase
MGRTSWDAFTDGGMPQTRQQNAANRYVERNPVRPGVVSRAQDWRWGSLWRREQGSEEQRQLLCDWPVARRADWVDWVNQPATAKQVEAWRRRIEKSCPSAKRPGGSASLGAWDWSTLCGSRAGQRPRTRNNQVRPL